MNDKLLQKKGRIISQIAAELLGKKVHDRFMPIMYYQEKYEASQGTVQNAVNFLKEKGAIRLRNKGYQGSYIEEIDYDILREYCDKRNLKGCMPLPHNGKLELLAFYLKEHLYNQDTHFEMAYVQNEDKQLACLLEDSCDFLVCTKHMAKRYMEMYPELKIAMEFDQFHMIDKPVLVRSDDSLTVLDVVSDCTILKMLGLHYAQIHQLKTHLISKKEILQNIKHQKKIFALLSQEDYFDYGNTVIPLQEAECKDDITGVLLMKKDREEVCDILLAYLHEKDLADVDKAYSNGDVELRY